MWQTFIDRFHGKTYEELVKNMRCRENIEVGRQILQHHQLPTTDSRILLSMFMLVRYPDDAFSSAKRTDTESALQSAAQRVLDSLGDDDDGDGDDCFISRFTHYRDLFHNWQRANKIELFVMLATTYHGHLQAIDVLRSTETTAAATAEATATAHTTATAEATAQIEHHMRDIEHRAARLGYSVEDLRNAELPPPPTTVAIEEGVQDICKRAFWDVFTEKFAAGDMSGLRVILTEIRDRLKAITPNRTDLCTELDEKIDADFIVPQIEGGAFHAEQFHRLTDFIRQRIKALQAAADDGDTATWWSEFNTQCASGKTYVELLPPFFDWVYGRIEKIERDTKAFRELILSNDTA